MAQGYERNIAECHVRLLRHYLKKGLKLSTELAEQKPQLREVRRSSMEKPLVLGPTPPPLLVFIVENIHKTGE